MINHLINKEIDNFVSHIQMYADDLIVIINNGRETTEEIIQSIYQILREYEKKRKNTFIKSNRIMIPHINNQLKITIYKVAIIPQILYGTETHEFSIQEYKQINTLMNTQMTQILRISRNRERRFKGILINFEKKLTSFQVRFFNQNKQLKDNEKRSDKIQSNKNDGEIQLNSNLCAKLTDLSFDSRN
ncbi:hypothetical protein M0811_04643 [Anaeramoeba ignava]|uniref:Uncharacterized protein n=1 Tax=Anaeramoeba ignava TaxID=1746090 RepID=A0A9Q0LX49_ANAIG|nr:hypothetical protein M0811_04643 [Anaeramoeba ignava]